MANASAAAHSLGREESPGLKVGAGLMLLGAFGFLVYAVIFFARNFSDNFLELGIGREQVDVGKEQIESFSPQLYDYISHLQIAVSGFMAGIGLAILFLVAFGVRRGYMWAWVGAVSSAVLALVIALPAHYPDNLDTLGHLGLIYLAAVIFAAGALVALPSMDREAERRGARLTSIDAN